MIFDFELNDCDLDLEYDFDLDLECDFDCDLDLDLSTCIPATHPLPQVLPSSTPTGSSPTTEKPTACLRATVSYLTTRALAEVNNHVTHIYTVYCFCIPVHGLGMRPDLRFSPGAQII